MSKGSVATRVLAVLALTWTGHAAIALEIGFDAETSNLQFPWTPVAPITGSQFPNSNYFWGGETWLTAPLGEDASVRFSLDRDPVLRNTAIAAVQFERGIARISVGPLVGFLNSDSAPISAGISAASQAPVARSRLRILTIGRRHGDIHHPGRGRSSGAHRTVRRILRSQRHRFGPDLRQALQRTRLVGRPRHRHFDALRDDN